MPPRRRKRPETPPSRDCVMSGTGTSVPTPPPPPAPGVKKKFKSVGSIAAEPIPVSAHSILSAVSAAIGDRPHPYPYHHHLLLIPRPLLEIIASYAVPFVTSFRYAEFQFASLSSAADDERERERDGGVYISCALDRESIIAFCGNGNQFYKYSIVTGMCMLCVCVTYDVRFRRVRCVRV